MGKKDNYLDDDVDEYYEEHEEYDDDPHEYDDVSVPKKPAAMPATSQKPAPQATPASNVGGASGNAAAKKEAATVTEKVEFPPDRTGMLIGRGGERIASIKAEFGVEMKTAREGGSVEVTGSAFNVRRAIKAIHTAVASDEVEIEIALPSGDHRFPARKHAGEHSRQYKVGILVDEARGVVVIRGSKEKVMNAKRALEKLIKDADASVTEEISVPSSLFGKLIGKGGAEAKRRQDCFGVRVKFDSEDESISITGPPTAVFRCIKDIENTLDLKSTSRPSGGGGRGRGRGRR